MNMFVIKKQTVKNVHKYTCGVVSVVVLLIVSSICAVCTSRVSNWCSNLSIRAVIWRKYVLKPDYACFCLECDVFKDTLPFLNSWTWVRHPCFSPLQPWISWPADKSHQPTQKQRDGGTDLGLLFILPVSWWQLFGLWRPPRPPERSSARNSQTGSSVWWRSPRGSSPPPCFPSGWPWGHTNAIHISKMHQGTEPAVTDTGHTGPAYFFDFTLLYFFFFVTLHRVSL